MTRIKNLFHLFSRRFNGSRYSHEFADSHRSAGFTLIELLVVIAIIGILSSVVLTNLNGTRQKARDVKRIADVQQLQLSLALYFDAKGGKYPGILNDLRPDFTSIIPTPPSGAGQASYNYVPLNSTCNSYHLGAALEQGTNTNLTSDVDATIGAVAVPADSACDVTGINTTVTASNDFYGTGANCDYGNSAGLAQPNGTEKCYDVAP